MSEQPERIEFSNRIEYRLNGILHREDGPAREWAVGNKAWYVDGKCHRSDGPAIEWADGDKEWRVDGNRHRLDGPAVEYASGYKEWYIMGIKVPKTEVDNFRIKTLTLSFVVNRRIWRKVI